MRHKVPKSGTLTARVTPEIQQAFFEKAELYGTPSDILRELVVAFIQDRFHIDPPILFQKGNPHVPRTQD